MNHHLLPQLLVLLGASFFLVAALVRLRFSPIVGYLAAGLLIGPHGLHLVTETEGSRLLGELGVALLMFVVGLEFSWPRMRAAGRLVLGGGGLQVGLTAVLGGSIAYAAGAGFLGAVVLGGALAMSSTAIVHKQLLEQDEAASRHGVTATGILLFQDLAALPLLALVGAVHHAGSGEPEVGGVLLRVAASVAAFLLAALLARRTVGRLLAWTARARSNEPFLLAALALIVAAAFAAESVGLSLPIGAFVVGMVVGESDFRHQLEDEIRPFRDLLLGLFFVTVGMAVDWSVVSAAPWLTFGALLLLVLLKLGAAYAAARILGEDRAGALRTGLLLAHGGEFALLLVSQSLGTGLLPAEIGQPALAAVALSMLLAAPLIQWNGRIVSAVFAPTSGDQHDRSWESAVANAGASLHGHVVIAGCGPVGRLVATALEASRVPYLAIERDPERLRRAQTDGHRVVFGDATRHGILRAAGVQRAGAVVALLEKRPRLERLIHEVRRLTPTVPIVVSTRDDVGLAPLVEAGATHIFPESYAAGLALAAQALVALGLPPAEALARVRAVRAELSPELRALPPT